MVAPEFVIAWMMLLPANMRRSYGTPNELRTKFPPFR